MKLIDAYALTRTMYLKSFDTDDGRQRWDSGLWIRYKIFEEARDEQPTVDAVPVSFIKEMKAWAEENGSAEYADDLTHLLERWKERKEE